MRRSEHRERVPQRLLRPRPLPGLAAKAQPHEIARLFRQTFRHRRREPAVRRGAEHRDRRVYRASVPRRRRRLFLFLVFVRLPLALLRSRRRVRVGITPRRLPRGHLEHDAPDAPDVRAPPVAALPDHLRRHPVRRPPDASAQEERARGGERRGLVELGVPVPPPALERGRAPEVRELDHAVGGDQHVRALDVPVHDAPRVDIRQRREYLPRVAPNQILPERTGSAERRGDRTAVRRVDELRHHAHGSVRVALGVHEPNHVRVVKPAEDLGLALELARQELARRRMRMSRRLGRVVGEPIAEPADAVRDRGAVAVDLEPRAVARSARDGGEDLDRGDLAGVDVFGAVHAAEGALADELEAPPSRRGGPRRRSRRGGSTGPPPGRAGDAAGGRVASVAERARVASGGRAGALARGARGTSRGRFRGREVDVVRGGGGVGTRDRGGARAVRGRAARVRRRGRRARLRGRGREAASHRARRAASRDANGDARASGVRGRRIGAARNDYSTRRSQTTIRSVATHVLRIKARRERARATLPSGDSSVNRIF